MPVNTNYSVTRMRTADVDVCTQSLNFKYILKNYPFLSLPCWNYLLILYVVRQSNHLIFDVYVVVQVPQTSLLESWGDLRDVTAQVLEQLCVSITSPEAQFGLAGQMDGVEDILVSETGRRTARCSASYLLHHCCCYNNTVCFGWETVWLSWSSCRFSPSFSLHTLFVTTLVVLHSMFSTL